MKTVTGLGVALALLLLFAGPARAFDSGWVRLTPEELFDYQISRQGVRINNFNLAEKGAFLAKGLTVLKLSFSAANRRQKPVQFSVQLVGLDDKNSLAFALTAEPSFSQVSAGKTEQVQSDIYVPPGELKKAEAFLLRVVGTL